MSIRKSAMKLIDQLRGRDNVAFVLTRSDGKQSAVYTEGDKTFASPDIPRKEDARTP